MVRKISSLTLITGLLLAVIMSSGHVPATAQGPDAWTSYDLNMRAGPGPSYAVVALLPANTGIIFEARNNDTSWLLGHTEDGALRGWVSTLYLAYQTGFAAARLPVSNEIIDAAPPAPAASEQPAPANDTAAQPAAPAAPGGVTAYATYDLNVRSGPGTAYDPVGKVQANTGLILEARNGDTAWVLAQAENGSVRGWLASQYIQFVGISAANLPVSSEIVDGTPTETASGETASDTTDDEAEEEVSEEDMIKHYNEARVRAIDLNAIPIVPTNLGRARSIYWQGQSMGNNPHVVAKVGDCSSEHWYFFKPFGWRKYSLGPYADLQPVIDHFGESFAIDSQATHNGFNANAVMKSFWASPAYCQEKETPLQCEYRINKPSVAIIMFGTSDLLVLTPYEYNFYMRDIVDQTIEAGVIPVLSTFPGNQGFWDKTILYNQIVVSIAQDFNIPLINLWLALEALPNQGLEADGFHLGEPLTGAADFNNGENMQTGYPTRNLVTLQTLDRIWRYAMR